MSPHVTRACLAALTLGAALLARRSPAWRSLAWCLAALTAIDAARLVTLPRASLRAWGWWQADVVLVAMWPAVMAWGLGAKRTSAALFYAVALGIARPYLPAAAYLAGLAVPRVVLAGIWAGAVWRMARGGRERDAGAHPRLGRAVARVERGEFGGTSGGRRFARRDEPQPVGVSEERSPRVLPASPKTRAPDREGREHANPTTSARLAQVCALVLAAGDVACALAPWSRVVVGAPPPWWVAQALTLASYAGAACVMGWAWRRRG